MSKFTTTTTVVHADGTSVQTVTTSGGGDAAGLTLASLQDGGMEGLLAEHGLDAATAAEKAALFAEAAAVLVADGTDPSTAAKAFFIPGRVEVMGKHTDYAGGRRCLYPFPHRHHTLLYLSARRRRGAACWRRSARPSAS